MPHLLAGNGLVKLSGDTRQHRISIDFVCNSAGLFIAQLDYIEGILDILVANHTKVSAATTYDIRLLDFNDANLLQDRAENLATNAISNIVLFYEDLGADRREYIWVMGDLLLYIESGASDYGHIDICLTLPEAYTLVTPFPDFSNRILNAWE